MDTSSKAGLNRQPLPEIINLLRVRSTEGTIWPWRPAASLLWLSFSTRLRRPCFSAGPGSRYLSPASGR